MELVVKNGVPVILVGFADGVVAPVRPPSLQELARYRPEMVIEHLMSLAVQAEKANATSVAQEYLEQAIRIEERFA